MQYPTPALGFMPVILMFGEHGFTATPTTYVQYDTSTTPSSTIFYTVDTLVINNNGDGKSVIGLGQPRDTS